MNEILGALSGGISDADEIYVPDNEMSNFLEGLGTLYHTDSKKARRVLNRFAESKNVKSGRIFHRREPATKNLTGKAIFERNILRIDPKLRQAYYKGGVTISDFAISVTKLADSKHIQMFKTGDTREVGIINIDGSQLANGNEMVVTSITVLSGVGAGATIADAEIIDFKKIHPIIANGEFIFKDGQETFFDGCSNGLFYHGASGEIKEGELKLQNPKVLTKNKNILFDIDIPAGLPANTFIKVMLNGMITVRN